MPLDPSQIQTPEFVIENILLRKPGASRDEIDAAYKLAFVEHLESSKHRRPNKRRKRRKGFQEGFVKRYPIPPFVYRPLNQESNKSLSVHSVAAALLVSGEKIAELQKTNIPPNVLGRCVLIYECQADIEMNEEMTKNVRKGTKGKIVGKVVFIHQEHVKTYSLDEVLHFTCLHDKEQLQEKIAQGYNRLWFIDSPVTYKTPFDPVFKNNQQGTVWSSLERRGSAPPVGNCCVKLPLHLLHGPARLKGIFEDRDAKRDADKQEEKKIKKLKDQADEQTEDDEQSDSDTSSASSASTSLSSSSDTLSSDSDTSSASSALSSGDGSDSELEDKPLSFLRNLSSSEFRKRANKERSPTRRDKRRKTADIVTPGGNNSAPYQGKVPLSKVPRLNKKLERSVMRETRTLRRWVRRDMRRDMESPSSDADDSSPSNSDTSFSSSSSSSSSTSSM